MSKDSMIRLILQDSDTGKTNVSVEINEQATIQNVISAYCAKRGIGYSSSLVVFDSSRNNLPNFRTLQSLGIGNGHTLHIGHQKKSTSLDRKWIFILTVMVMSISILAIILMASFYATSGAPAPFEFGVVMDGGSSKTNVILYKWAGDKEKGTGCVREETKCKADGGIAKQENVSYVLPCVEKVQKHIKSSSVSNSPLYFASTAGMRLLRLSDEAKADQKLDELRFILNDTGMSLQTVEIISGADEGKYDWITANFLKDTLEKEPKQNPWLPATVGALDMGGASAQIAFAIEPTTNNADPEVETVELYGQKHNVFASSSLCFGRDEAELRHRALLVKDPSQLTNIPDPCSPRGYSYNVTGKKLFSEVCTETPQFLGWLNDDPQLKDEVVTYVGSADYQGCSVAMKKLVNTDECKSKNFKRCFRKINKPVNNQNFLAFATYFYTTSGLKLTKSTFDEFIKGVQEYCSRNISQVDLKKKFTTDYCFNACYMSEVLFTGYGFSNDTWSNIEFLGDIAEKEISWPLGYMINATNVIPAEKPTPKFTTVGVFAACMIIFIFIALAAAVFLAYNFGRKSSDQYSLQNA